MSFENGLESSENLCSSSTCSFSGWSLLEFVTFCLVIWWISYFFLLIVSNQSKEWNCRFLTLFHGSYVSYLALSDIFFHWRDMEFHNGSLTEDQKNYLSIMTSYFLFDLSWMILFGNEAWIIHFHHLVSLLLLSKVMMSDVGGIWIDYGVAGLEATNPYLQIRWFLRTYGYNNKPIHTLVEIWFFIWFFLIRVIFGTIYVYYLEVQPNPDTYLKFLFIIIFLVSLALAWEICRYVKKKYCCQRNRVNFFLDPVISEVNQSFYASNRTSSVESTTNAEDDDPNVKNLRDSLWASQNESF